MKDELILISRDGPHRNVLKLKPPMVFTNQNVDHFIKVIGKVLNEVESDLRLCSSLLSENELENERENDSSDNKSEISDEDNAQVGGDNQQQYQNHPQLGLKIHAQ